MLHFTSPKIFGKNLQRNLLNGISKKIHQVGMRKFLRNIWSEWELKREKLRNLPRPHSNNLSWVKELQFKRKPHQLL